MLMMTALQKGSGEPHKSLAPRKKSSLYLSDFLTFGRQKKLEKNLKERQLQWREKTKILLKIKKLRATNLIFTHHNILKATTTRTTKRTIFGTCRRNVVE